MWTVLVVTFGTGRASIFRDISSVVYIYIYIYIIAVKSYTEILK
jgi:hypothetical protein